MANEHRKRVGRSPSMLTIGSVRVRFISHKDQSVLPSGGSNSGNEETCCCSSSLPQISIANANNRNSLVYRSSLQWKHYSCFGSDKYNSEEKNGVNLIQDRSSPPAKPRDLDSFPRHTLNHVNSREKTLDRFSDLRLAGGDILLRGGKRGGNKKKHRSSDKTEPLKQLTAKLVSASTSQQEQSNKESEISAPTLTKPNETPSKEDDIFNLKFNKPESRTIVGSYTQRSIPFRSASFSQVDFLPEGKYARGNQAIRTTPQPPGSSTLPRKKIVEPVIYKRDVNSVERILPKPLSEAFSGPKFSARALTHPLGKPLSLSSTNIPYNTSDDSGLRSLSYQKIPESQLEEDIEVYHPPHASSLPPSPFPPPQPPKRNKHKLVKEAANTSKDESQSAEESLSIIKECCTQLSNFDQPTPISNKNGTQTSTRLSVNEEENNKTDTSPNENEKANKTEENIEKNVDNDTANVITDTSESKEESKTVPDDQQPTEPNSTNLSSNDSGKLQESEDTLPSPGCSDISEPLFPDPLKPEPVVAKTSESGIISKLKNDSTFSMTPRFTRSSSTPKSIERTLEKLKTEFQHEGSEGRTNPRRIYMFSRADSLSEGDSDQGDKHREGTASPSPMIPSDCSDYENRMNKISSRRFSKKPLRGPLLEAEMKKMKLGKVPSEDFQFLDDIGPMRHRAIDDCHLKRTYSAAAATTLPKRKNSIGLPYSLSVNPVSGGIHHQRTTSSPSQLEGCAESNAKLFEKLMKGSSERLLVPPEVIPNKSVNKQKVDTRTHVVVELYETEKSYVEALQTIVTRYLEPLKSGDLDDRLIEPSMVDDIFYQIPEILSEHEEFLDALKKRLDIWDINQSVGDLILATFTKQSVVEAYTAFINNWKSARETIKSTCHARPAFAKFLENMSREHKGKLALDSLLIMPVQRIPRYELLLQTLIKHTDESHTDFTLLREAQKEIHELAVKINCTERESLELEQIESLIDGLIHLVAAERTFLRHDLVTIASSQGNTRKERALFLFSDLLVITSIKRRSGATRKCSASYPGTIASTLEVNKYKLLTKIPLHDLDVVKIKDDNIRRVLREINTLSEDVTTLSQMIDLSANLHCSHDQLEDCLRETLTSLHKQLNERQNNESQLTYLELMLNTRDGIENISMVFPSPEKRASWEESFTEAKQRLALSGERRLWPEFVTPVPIRKTRAGLQFTCASPALGQRDVWVCNSDGYVGQVCVLSLHPEPSVVSCNGVCNARILCVACIPPLDHRNNAPNEDMFNNTGISISVEDTSKSSANIQLDSSSSSEDENEDDEEQICDQDEEGAGEDELQMQATMWLGTEDGCIHVYNCVDNIRIKKNKLKIQHGSAVHSIIYLDNCVFVSLATGEVCVYSRDPNYGTWNTSEPSIITVGSAATPVTKMLPVHNRLWCTCHNLIKILNVTTLQMENSFVVGHVSCFVTTGPNGYGVWAALHNSSVMRLIHSISLEVLCEVNIAPAVSKILANCDEIIRQHKSACLRVTSLLACKELLWIGTSAGVVLTMPLPHINQNTSKITTTPIVSGVPHGHTGHVRFLTAVETPLRGSKTHSTNNDKKKNSPRMRTKRTLVISGGDGYEDFRSSSISEVAGREDSTNHLLLWHV
uniref:Rho guanine nucleotide exchange factor 17 n=1 Tax=Cacopsylla melanoneura TaxID=428564 RepID=A0A8D9BUD0_9HEMI